MKILCLERSLYLVLVVAISSILSAANGSNWNQPTRPSNFLRCQSCVVTLPRGGGTPSAPIASNSNSHRLPDFPTTSSISATAAEVAASLWIVSRHVISKHVLPVVQNPHDRVIVPLQTMFREAQTTQSQQQQQRQQQHTTKVETPLSTATHIVKVTTKTSTTDDRKRDKASNGSNRPTNAMTNTNKNTLNLQLVLLPARFFKLSIVAFVLAEILDRIGILHEETPKELRSQVLSVWYDVQPHMSNWQEKCLGVWKRLRKLAPKNIQSMPTKYQFALGAGVGMIASPVLASLVWSLFPPALVLYGLAEINAQANTEGRTWNLSTLLAEVAGRSGDQKTTTPEWGKRLESGLENFRQAVRNCVPAPPTSTRSSSFLLETSGGNTKPRYSLGVSGYCRNEPPISKRQLWHKRLFALGNQSDRSLVEVRENIVEAVDSNPVVEMVRHGFLVGGLVGLVARV